MTQPNPFNPTGRSMSADEVQRIATERLAAHQELQWLERLEKNEDFQRFVAFWQQGVDVLKTELLDVKRPTEERLALTDRYLSLEQVPIWHRKRIEELTATVKELERQLQKAAR